MSIIVKSVALAVVLFNINLFAQHPDFDPSANDLREGKAISRPNSGDNNPIAPGLMRQGFAVTPGGTTTTTPILYHNGPVMSNPAIYIIFYGDWNQTNGSDNAAGKQIVVDWANGIGGTPHYALNASYGTASYPTAGAAHFGGATTLTGTYSKRLRDSDILKIVDTTITSGALGAFVSDAVYFLVTSSDVTATSGFCTQYCGWHTHAVKSYGDLKYSFVGNANRCVTGCAAQTTSPNGNPGVDGSVSVLTHELEEAHSDPDLNAWSDSAGAENADKCAWTFGHFLGTAANGSKYNMSFGGRNWLIQRNLWHTTGGDLCMVDSTHN